MADLSAGAGLTATVRRVAPPPPTDRLLVSVGGSPVPVLLALLGLRPSTVVALVTHQSAAAWERILGAAASLDPGLGSMSTRCVTVPAHDGRAVGEAVVQVIASGGSWELAYSGGTPAMAGGAFGAWWAAREPSAGAWYVAEEGDALIRHDGCYVDTAAILAGRNLPLAGMLDLHGLSAAGLEQHPEVWRPHNADGVTAARARAALRSLPTHGPAAHLQEFSRRARAVVTDALAVLARPTSMDVYQPTIARLPPSQHLVGPQTLELGICVVDGLFLRMVEVASYTRRDGDPQCGRSWRLGGLKEALFDASQRAQRAGGIRADTGLLCLDPRHSARGLGGLYLDQGPWTPPDRLPDSPDQAGEQPLPATTAFALAELHEALVQSGDYVALHEGNDLACWLSGGQR